MMAPAIKNLGTAITNGCADCKPIFVAADADDQSMAKKTPAIKSVTVFEADFFKTLQKYLLQRR